MLRPLRHPEDKGSRTCFRVNTGRGAQAARGMALSRFAPSDIQVISGWIRRGGLSSLTSNRHDLSSGSPHPACGALTLAALVAQLDGIVAASIRNGCRLSRDRSDSPRPLARLTNRDPCKVSTTCANAFHVKHRHSSRRAHASRAIARQAVRPGDSMPKRLSRPETP